MKTKENGITLIALIVTIVVLLILAGVSISSLFGDSGIIDEAQNAQETMDNAKEKNEMSMAYTKWCLEYKTKNTPFVDFMQKRFGEDKVEKVSEDEVTVTLKNGNKYKVKKDGTITSTKGISINTSSLTLELQEGTTVTETLTASLTDITGEITWSISDNTKATISATKGGSVTVTAVAGGTTTITATCGSYTTTCAVTVKKAMVIGSYVEYDVPYTDMYSGTEYTKTTGWRYLGKDDSGNQLIVSTGIPAILYYNYTGNIGNTADGGANSWWATKAEISATTDTLYQTTKGYDYNTDSGEPNKYAAYGLRYKFESIPFTYQASGTSVSTKNTGIFRKVGNTTSGTNISLNFKADGVNVVDVHNLTLAELNRATSKASGTTRADNATSEGFKDLTETASGLFDMQDLTGYTEYYYWLANTPAWSRNYVELVNYDFSSINGYTFRCGIRPVVTLSSDVKLTVVATE